MKYLRTLWMLLAVLCLTNSCIKEDREDCEHVSLYFRYLADGTYNVLQDYMDRVDLYVYNDQNNLVRQVTYTQADLRNRYETPKFRLDAGKYHVVIIGNQYERTLLHNNTSGSFSNMLFTHPGLGIEDMIEGQDANYLGYKDITIPADVSYCDTVDLHCSHIDVDIFVSGLKYIHGDEGYESAYDVVIENAPAETDFFNRVTERQTTIRPKVSFNDDKNRFYTTDLNIFRFTPETPMVLKVRQMAGEQYGRVLAEMELKQFLADNYRPGSTNPGDINISKLYDNKEEIRIPIYITFATGDITLNPPKWSVVDMSAEWNEFKK